MKSLHPELQALLEEMRQAGRPDDVITFPLGHPVEDGWVIYVKNVPVEAILQASRDLAEKGASWPKNTLIKSRGPFPVVR